AEVGGEAQAGRRRDVPDPRRPGGGPARPPDLEWRAGEAWPHRALGVHLAGEHLTLRRAHTAGRLVGQHLAGGVEAKVMAFLEIRGLSKTFPGVTALDGVDLSAEGGEVRALLGAHGDEQLRRLPDPSRLPLHPAAQVGRLPVAGQQRVEIARALSIAARVLILDEPTAVLSLAEQRNLFDIIAGLKGPRLLILYVSHRL